MPVPHDLLEKDPDAELLYVMDWTDWLPSGSTITSSTWEIEGVDSELTADNSTIVTGGLKTQARLLGGTLGERYLVRNLVVITGAPTQTDYRSVTIAIVKQ